MSFFFSPTPPPPQLSRVSRYSLLFPADWRGGRTQIRRQKTNCGPLFIYSCTFVPTTAIHLLSTVHLYLPIRFCNIFSSIWLRKRNNFSFLSGFARNCFISRPKAYYYWDSDKILARIFTRPPAENRISPFNFSESMEEASNV
jgi:hypothetical protein